MANEKDSVENEYIDFFCSLADIVVKEEHIRDKKIVLQLSQILALTTPNSAIRMWLISVVQTIFDENMDFLRLFQSEFPSSLSDSFRHKLTHEFVSRKCRFLGKDPAILVEHFFT